MPIDSRIPLGVNSISVPNLMMAVQQYKGAQKQNELADMALQRAKDAKPLESATTSNELDMQRLKSTVLGAERLRTFVEAGDLGGALADLQSRKATLDARGTDSSDTDRAIASVQEAIQTGDQTKLKAGLDQARQVGTKYGVLQGGYGAPVAGPDGSILQPGPNGELKSVLGRERAPASDHGVVKTVGPDGKPVYTPRANAAGKEAYQAPVSGSVVSSEAVETTAQLIAGGQLPMLTGYTLKSPFGQQVVQRVSEINPEFQGGQYPARTSTMRAFASGTESRTVRSLNVAIAHLGTLSALADALNNGNVQALNEARNTWKTQTGNPAPTNFTSARDIVANEVVKSVTASGGTLADREEARRQIQAAASPAQLSGVVKTWKQLLGGQLGGLQQQYEQGTGQSDFQRFLSPETIRELEGGSGAEPQVTPNANAKGWVLHVDAQGNKAYVSPDGKQFEEVK